MIVVHIRRVLFADHFPHTVAKSRSQGLPVHGELEGLVSSATVLVQDNTSYNDDNDN